MSSTSITRTRIYQELNTRASGAATDREASDPEVSRRLRGQIDASLDDIERYLNEIRRYFDHFTDHSIRHSAAILSNISKLLSDEQVKLLSDVELYLTIASALVHDIGMVVAPDEIPTLTKDPRFLEYLRTVRPDIASSPIDGEWFRYGNGRLVLAEFVRRIHGRRSELLLDTDCRPVVKLTGHEPELVKWVGRIAVGHSLDHEDLQRSREYPSDVLVLGTQPTNILFLTLLLRLGDLLDITTRRADPMIRRLSEPLPFMSSEHWDQYTDIEVRDLGLQTPIRLSGTCPSQDADRLLREWYDWLRLESEYSVLALNSGPTRYRLAVGHILYEVEPRRDRHGNPLYEFSRYRFNLDEETVFRRLFGRRLYGRVDVAIRELLQNAIDATTMRCALTESSSADWEDLQDIERRKRVRDRLASAEFAILVSLEQRGGDERKEWWLTVSDSGVGMSRGALRKYFLKVGRSRWGSDPRTKALKITATGEFGLGFLSTFMISDRTIVSTKSCLPDEDGLRATIYSWKGYLATEPYSSDRPGTSVSLRLKSELAKELVDALPETVGYWCPFPPVTLIVRENGTARGRVDALRLGNTASGESCAFEFGNEGSVATLWTHAAARNSKTNCPSLCQDGIVVAQVSPPDRSTPDVSSLFAHGLRVNLVGGDRVPLDLSRNLAEGDTELLWQKLVPEIWNGLVRNGLRHRACWETLSDAVQRLSDAGLADQLVIVDLERGLRIDNEASVDCRAGVRLIDVFDKRIANFDEDYSRPTLVVPNTSRTIRDARETWLARSEATSFRGLSGMRPMSYTTMGRHLVPLLSRSAVVAQTWDGLLETRSTSTDNSVLLHDLGFLRATDNWFAIRDPFYRRWCVVEQTDLDLGGTDIPPEIVQNLTYEQYVVLMLYFLWPEPTYWTTWPCKEGLPLGEVLSKALDQFGVGEIEQSTESADGAWEDLPGDDDGEDEYGDEAVDDNYTEPCRSDLVTVATRILPSLSLAEIESAVAPWDRLRWQSDKWDA